ncbi:hypothetical protein WJX74_005539 [Apatococcus lobatus]|uniref:Uncharacterized protein n=1 Tax=Apatococcus lobatus TaxID=904363 RepID=A0AAW1QC24_9CHLO
MGVRSVFCVEPPPEGPGQLDKTTSNAKQPRGILRKVRSVLKGELGNNGADQQSGSSPWPEMDAQSPNMVAKPAPGIQPGPKAQSPSKDITAVAVPAAQPAQGSQVIPNTGPAARPPSAAGAAPTGSGTSRPGSAKGKGPSRVASRSNSTTGRLMGLLKSGGSKDFNRAPDPKSARVTETNPKSVRTTESNYDFTDHTRKRPSDAQVSISPKTRPGGILGVPETILDSNNSVDGIQGVPAPVILVGDQTRAGPLKDSPTPQADPPAPSASASGAVRASQVSTFDAITAKHAAAAAVPHSAPTNAAAPTASRTAAVNPQPAAAPVQVAPPAASAKKPITSLEDVDAMVPQQSENSSDFITSSRSQYNRGNNPTGKGNEDFETPRDRPEVTTGAASNSAGYDIRAAPDVSVSSSTRFGRIWDHPDDAPPGNTSLGGNDTAISGNWQLGLNPNQEGQAVGQSASRSGHMSAILAAQAGFPATHTGHIIPHGGESLGGGIQRTWSQEGGMLHEPSHVSESSPTKTVRVLDRAGSGDIPKAKVTLGGHTRMGGFQDWGDEVTGGNNDSPLYHQRSHLAPRDLYEEPRERHVQQPQAAAVVGQPRLEQHVPPPSAFSNPDAQFDQPSSDQDSHRAMFEASKHHARSANGSQNTEHGPIHSGNEHPANFRSDNRQEASREIQRGDGFESGNQESGAGRRSHATEVPQEHFNKSVREIERQGSGSDIPHSKVTMGPKTRLGGFGDWSQDQLTGSSAAASAVAPSGSSGHSNFNPQAPSASWGPSGVVGDARSAHTRGPQDAFGQRPSAVSGPMEVSFSTPKRPTGVGERGGLSSHAIELSADKYGGHYDNGVISTPDELYTTAESIPTPLLVRGQGGNSYSRNEAGFHSPGSSAVPQGVGPGDLAKEVKGPQARASKGLAQSGSKDQLALDSEGEEWLTAEGVRSAGSPEMRVRMLDAETKRLGTINTGSSGEEGKIKAHTVRQRIASDEDTPMSPSTVKAKGYWTNTAGPRLRPSETGVAR